MASYVLGDLRCTYLVTGSFEVDTASIFGNAPAGELAEALERHGFDPEKLVFTVRSLFVDTGSNRVVIDPSGDWEDPHHLEIALEQAGIDPGSVDTVIVSHGHADHFWGGVRADGSPLFTNARHCMQRQEWEHWLTDDNPEPDHVESFRRALLPLEERFSLADGAQEIVPGIRCQPTPGHSPGHMAVRIGEQAIYTGDILLNPINVERPDWASSFDVWPEQVIASRRELLRQAASDDLLVFTCHFPGSGAGTVVADRNRGGDGWRWQPEQLG